MLNINDIRRPEAEAEQECETAEITCPEENMLLSPVVMRIPVLHGTIFDFSFCFLTKAQLLCTFGSFA